MPARCPEGQPESRAPALPQVQAWALAVGPRDARRSQANLLARWFPATFGVPKRESAACERSGHSASLLSRLAELRNSLLILPVGANGRKKAWTAKRFRRWR